MKKREVDLEPQYSIEEDRKGKGKRTVDLNDVANIVLFLAAFVGIWQLVFTLGIWPKVSMPSPAMVAESFVQLIQNITLITSIGMTMWRLAIGFGILFVVVMSSVFSVMISTYSGINNIPPIYIRAARNMGARGLSLFRYVMIPAATPSLIVGIKQAWSFAWHALIGAEILIAASVGLGHILLVGREFQLMDQIIASMITIFAIGLLFDRLVFSKLEDKVRDRWGLKQGSE